MTIGVHLYVFGSEAFSEFSIVKFCISKIQMWFSVSHTTDEMVFQWDPEVPLVVDENIELPQLQLVENRIADCTQVYSTGVYAIIMISTRYKLVENTNQEFLR